MTTTEKPVLKIVPRLEAPGDVFPDVKAMPQTIRRHTTDDQICVLTFDRSDSAVNLFDKLTLLELDAHLDFITASPQLKGVVFLSAKQSIFIAGADLKALSEAADPEALRYLIELGQSVFNRIAALPIPTVAAIHGACVGGGYEICLACNYRIASPERATRIGLPEVQLGIIPAWGGSTRLPRLIGLPKALDIILAGKTVAAKPALRSGMVDELVPREYLLDIAVKRILKLGRALRPRRHLLKLALFNSSMTAKVLHKKLVRQLLAKTRGHYPAVLKALDVVTIGITRSMETSLALERDAILELGRTETAHNLIRVFFLQERAKKLTYGPRDSGRRSESSESLPAADALLAKRAAPPIKRLAVIGAGVMGAGIAQWSSAREVPVVLRDINAEAVAKGLAGIARLFQQGVKRHTFTPLEARAGLDRIFPAPSDVPLTHVDLVIEAAVEKMELKKQLFGRLDELSGPNTILATNTSALSVAEIASATRHPQRVVGIHFFNPVHRMQLVEVVVAPQTDPDVVRRAIRFTQQIGKLPIVVKDSPGFLVNRILMPYLIEAGYLFEHGARVEDIDECMLEFGMPMGPLRLIDEVGVDVSKHVADTLASHFPDRMAAPQVLDKLLAAGLLGKKSGLGFYHYDKKGKEEGVNPQIDRHPVDAACAKLSRDELRTRMVLLMVNESVRCLEEGLVAEPADVDFGMIMGTGFAPFLGGPLRFADFIGVPQIKEEMRRVAEKAGPRFAPSLLLQNMAAQGKKFYER